jgi:large subunit ribosomal protein L35
MPKMKTNSSAKKRFKKLGSGKIKFAKAFRRHLLTKKSSKRKRGMRKAGYFSTSDMSHVRRLLP